MSLLYTGPSELIPMKPLERYARIARLTLALLVAGLLINCTPTFVYRNADWIVLWKADHYFDLTKDQKTFLRVRLKELLARHRFEALPVYERFLNEVKSRSSDGLNREEVDWIFETYQQLRQDFFVRIVDDTAVFLTSVNAQQVRNLEEAFRDDNEKADRLAKEKTETRLAKREAATIDWLKDWLGSLTVEQKQRITQLSRALPDTERTWAEYQKFRQQEILQLLRSTRDPHIVSQRLQDWLVFSEMNHPSQYQHALEDMRSAVKEMVIAIDHMLTPQQRARTLTKLQDLINDIHALSAS